MLILTPLHRSKHSASQLSRNCLSARLTAGTVTGTTGSSTTTCIGRSISTSRRLRTRYFESYDDPSKQQKQRITQSCNYYVNHHHQIRWFGSWPKIRPIRIRAISMDVTGTLVSFRGSLSQHYVKSAEKCGVVLPKAMQFDQAFKIAYKEISHLYPCFGYNTMTGKEWWRHCVLRSFEIAGANMTEVQKDRVFQRIYSIFGSQVAYERFDDALPFLQWANRQNIACGLLSNADERYGDSILPMLGLTHDEIQFQCFSKYYGYEKPDHRLFMATMQRAEDALQEMENSDVLIAGSGSSSSSSDASPTSTIDPLLPSQCLHVGNDYTKDFEGARRAGMHAVLLDRYDEPELAEEWRRRGAIVLKDLMDIVEFLGRTNCQLGNNNSQSKYGS